MPKHLPWFPRLRARLRGAWPVAYLGDHLALTETIYGRRIFVDTRDNSLAPSLLMRGEWERRISGVFRSVISPGMTVVDVGANFGWYSLLAADLVGKRGLVVSIDANPAMAALVARSAAANSFSGRMRIENIAASDRAGELTLYVDQAFMGGGSLYGSATPEEIAAGAKKRYAVPARPLDDLFAPGARVDVIKIDAEGAEPAILRGASRIIRDNPRLCILMEFGTIMLAGSHGSPVNFHREIRALGLLPFRIAKGRFGRGSWRLAPFSEADAAAEGFHNLLLRRT